MQTVFHLIVAVNIAYILHRFFQDFKIYIDISPDLHINVGGNFYPFFGISIEMSPLIILAFFSIANFMLVDNNIDIYMIDVGTGHHINVKDCFDDNVLCQQFCFS